MMTIVAFLLTFFTNNLTGILVGMFIGWHVPQPQFLITLYSDGLNWFWGLFKSAFAWLWSKITGML